ncbi:DUF538 domain-containing protein [Tanacetum coccineum]
MSFNKTEMGTMGMVFLSFCYCILFLSVDGNGEPSAYEVLKSYNLPIGVLPKGALGYTLDRNSGQFSVNLSSNCNVHVSEFDVKYNSPITGVISQNNLGRIGGVKVKIALFWTDIENVNRDRNQLRFKIRKVGTKSFPVSDFNSCPNC